MHKYIVEKIINAGFECYYVGGFVRDSIMGIKSEDIDLATNAKPHELAIIFADDKIDFVGETFKVLIVNGVEVATYRKDHYFGGSDKNCKIEYAETIEEDLARRDLTINALAQCVKTGNIIDPFGGAEDISNKIVRFVGNPYDRINEDPNRMIRVARFVAKIDGEIEEQTLDAIRNSHHLFEKIAKERISKEIIKAMKIKKASAFFVALHKMGLLQYIFPTLNRCFFHDGGPHHEEDLFTHMMVAGDYISTRCYILKLAGYLHDIGKVKAYSPVERSFHAHEVFGERIVQKELKELKFSNDDINKIKAYVKFHMRNNYGKEKSVRKLIRELGENGLNYRSHTRLKCADRAANLAKRNFSFSEIKNILEKYEELFTGNADSVFSIRDLAVNGYDIINTFNLKPGKIVGDILQFTLEAVYDNSVKNVKEDIVDYVKNNFNFGRYE